MPKAFGIIALFVFARACGAQSAVDSGTPSPAGEISWLPLPVEEIEPADELDDGRAGDLGLYASVAFRDGRAQLRRVDAARAGTSLDARASVLGGVECAEAWTVALESPVSAVGVLAGRITAGAAGNPFAEAVGLARRASRIPMARPDPPSFSASTGTSSPAIEGIAMTRPPGAARAGGWMIAGRRSLDGARIAAAGVAAPAPWGAWSVAAGTRGGLKALGASVEARWAGGTVGAEGSLGPQRPAAVVSVENRDGRLRLRGRWRYRGADARPTACEITAEAGSRWARGRMRLVEGPSGATGSTGRIEGEGTLGSSAAGPMTLRIGRSRTEGFSAAEGATLRRERYAVFEATVARSRGRRLSVLATRREREMSGGLRSGASLGATLDLIWRRRGALRLFVEATRVDAGGGSAWGNALFAGGAASLESRSRPGVSASARGTLRVGRWSLGGLIQGREEPAGRRATAATIWIQRSLPAPGR